ncbi:MAG TPA: serine/threonine-protein kinase, partial [Kofleriaceae bacterium]|nr:serine/threonine-protein kinase [Kofleriaceae bacterium]
MQGSDDGAGDSGRTRPLGRAGRAGSSERAAVTVPGGPAGRASAPSNHGSASASGDAGDPGRASTGPATPGSGDPTPALPGAEMSPWGSAIVPGSTLGRYEVVSKLGEGGMGVVLLAIDPALGRKVALKVLHQDLAEQAEAARRRLLREAQGIAQLTHDNVVTVHDVGTHDGRVYLAMEYVAGQTLGGWQRGKAWREVVANYLRAGRGLLAAHEAGLVHRDFKPDNVLVSSDGRVRVTDFGLVSAVDDQPAAGAPGAAAGAGPRREELELGVSMTKTGSIMGTPRYMAPEQHLGQPVDARADQFAFCVALYEALYGQPPFLDVSYSVLVGSVLSGEVTPVPAGSAVPPAVRDLVLRGLAHDREARHPSMRELLAGLEAAIAPPPPRRRWWP